MGFLKRNFLALFFTTLMVFAFSAYITDFSKSHAQEQTEVQVQEQTEVQVQESVTYVTAQAENLDSYDDAIFKLCKDETGEPKLCSDTETVMSIVAILAASKGAKGAALGFIITQILLLIYLMPAFRQKFPKLQTGRIKFIVANVLTAFTVAFSMMQTGASAGTSFTSGVVIGLLGTGLHQLLKQVLTKKGNT